MKLSDFFKQAVRLGSLRDPRKRKITVYEDSAILFGKSATSVSKIMVGIDIEAPELLLADRIRQKEGLDLVVSHHPEGRAFAALYQVMQLQVDVLKSSGLKEPIAQKLLEERMLEVERRLLPQNSMRAQEAAALLDMPFVCLHTPADNHVFWYVGRLMGKEKPQSLQDIIDILLKIEEYRYAESIFAGPRIILGNPKRKAGKIMVDMTGGTEGPKDVFDKLYKAEVRTLICMHLSEEHFKKVKDAKLNVVIAGHISSDTLGLNLLLDGVEKASGERFETIACSGFKRIRRN